MKPSIGVIGQGFVGGTLTTVFAEHGVTVYPFDKSGKYVTGGTELNNAFPQTINELMQGCEAIPDFSKIYFVCVPTPMYEDGGADISIVQGVLTALAQFPGERIAVVKSTVPPGTTDAWNKEFNAQGLQVIFNPEFLTEANCLHDMRNQSRVVLGGESEAVNKVRDLYHTAFPDVPVLKTTKPATAEMVKYFTNLQLAVKVILSCEMYQICEALNAHDIPTDYDRLVEFAKYDKRLGNTHMNVPGAEGVMGARGHCFPKDLNALIYVAKALGVKPTVLAAAWEKNLEVIPPELRDWEHMHDRAVSKRA